MSELNQLRVFLLSLSLFSALNELVRNKRRRQRRLQRRRHFTAVFTANTGGAETIAAAALTSDYAYRQVAHLSGNIGPRLTRSSAGSQRRRVNRQRIESHQLQCSSKK
jgi:hypothetical protein